MLGLPLGSLAALVLDADLAVKLADLDEQQSEGRELGDRAGAAPAWTTAPALPDTDPFAEVPSQLRPLMGG